MDNSVPRVELKRVNPFMGLMIDADTWRDSHDYHRYVEQAHNLSLHGWGIASGLEVDAADPADRSVWIRPGVAMDSEGRLIIVAQPFRYQIVTQDAGLIYLVLMFREIPTDNVLSLEDNTEKPSRLREAYAIYERDRLPDQPHVELARIQLTSGKKNIKDPSDPTNPGNDEVDKRFREQAAIRPGPRTTIGVWKPGDVAGNLAHHLAGPVRLLSSLSSGTEWRLRRRDQPEGPEEPLSCDLLIMPVTAKTLLNEKDRNRLDTYLDGGGVMVAEACASGSDADSQRVMATMAQALGRKPQPVARAHSLLTARHVFSAAPPGAVAGQVFEGDGLILSTADYSCAWNGGTVDKGLDRAIIRSAVEFAENMLAYALQRRGNVLRKQYTSTKGK
jgi:hypothetical protein